MDVELEDQIFQVKEIIPPLATQCVECKFKEGIKVFQRGPNISEIFVLEVQIFQQN